MLNIYALFLGERISVALASSHAPPLFLPLMTIKGLNLIFHTIGKGGGTERYVADIIRACSRRSIPLRVVCRRFRWVGEFPGNVELVLLRDKTPFAKLNNMIFESIAVSKCRRDFPTISVSRVPDAVDIAIAGGTHVEHLARKGKKPGFFDRRTIRNENILFNSAHAVIAHSEETQEEIKRHYGADASLLYPPVDTSFFSLASRVEREKTRNELGVGDRMLLLFPSNDHQRKGLDLILESMDAFRGKILLAIAGKKKIKHPDTTSLGLRQDMPRLYAAADATILASTYEPFGLVGPESVLCGTPVIFPNTVRASEVLSDDVCIRFQLSAESLKEALAFSLDKFSDGRLSISDADRHIFYPFSIDAHLDEILSKLEYRTEAVMPS